MQQVAAPSPKPDQLSSLDALQGFLLSTMQHQQGSGTSARAAGTLGSSSTRASAPDLHALLTSSSLPTAASPFKPQLGGSLWPQSPSALLGLGGLTWPATATAENALLECGANWDLDSCGIDTPSARQNLADMLCSPAFRNQNLSRMFAPADGNSNANTSGLLGNLATGLDMNALLGNLASQQAFRGMGSQTDKTQADNAAASKDNEFGSSNDAELVQKASSDHDPDGCTATEAIVTPGPPQLIRTATPGLLSQSDHNSPDQHSGPVVTNGGRRVLNFDTAAEQSASADMHATPGRLPATSENKKNSSRVDHVILPSARAVRPVGVTSPAAAVLPPLGVNSPNVFAIKEQPATKNNHSTMSDSETMSETSGNAKGGGQWSGLQADKSGAKPTSRVLQYSLNGSDIAQQQSNLLMAITQAPASAAPRSCHCKKSQCLKLYCDCFAAGMYCTMCSCADCYNKPEHALEVQSRRERIMQRDPKAFIRKIQKDEQQGAERHKKGCNCKRSHCLKKYCECYQGGVKCSHNCKCLDCHNQPDDLGMAHTTPPMRQRAQRATAAAAAATLAQFMSSDAGQGYHAVVPVDVSEESEMPPHRPAKPPKSAARVKDSDAIRQLKSEAAEASQGRHSPALVSQTSQKPAASQHDKHNQHLTYSASKQGGTNGPVTVPELGADNGKAAELESGMTTPRQHKTSAGMAGSDPSNVPAGGETLLLGGLRATPNTLRYPYSSLAGLGLTSDEAGEGASNPGATNRYLQVQPLMNALQLLHTPRPADQATTNGNTLPQLGGIEGISALLGGGLPLSTTGLVLPALGGLGLGLGSPGLDLSALTTGNLGLSALMGARANGLGDAAEALLRAPTEDLGPEDDNSARHVLNNSSTAQGSKTGLGKGSISPSQSQAQGSASNPMGNRTNMRDANGDMAALIGSASLGESSRSIGKNANNGWVSSGPEANNFSVQSPAKSGEQAASMNSAEFGSGSQGAVGGVHALVSPVRTSRRGATSGVKRSLAVSMYGNGSGPSNSGQNSGSVNALTVDNGGVMPMPTSPALDALACVAAEESQKFAQKSNPAVAKLMDEQQVGSCSPSKRSALGAGRHPTRHATIDSQQTRQDDGASHAAVPSGSLQAARTITTDSANPAPSPLDLLKAQASDYINSRCRNGMPNNGVQTRSTTANMNQANTGNASRPGNGNTTATGNHQDSNKSVATRPASIPPGLPPVKCSLPSTNPTNQAGIGSEASSLTLAGLPASQLASRLSNGSETGGLPAHNSNGDQGLPSCDLGHLPRISSAAALSLLSGNSTLPALFCSTPWSEANEGLAGGSDGCFLSPLATWDTSSLLLSPRVTTPLYTKGGQAINSPFFTLGSPTRWWTNSGAAALLGAATPLPRSNSQTFLGQVLAGDGKQDQQFDDGNVGGGSDKGGLHGMRHSLDASPADDGNMGGSASQLLRMCPGTTLIGPGAVSNTHQSNHKQPSTQQAGGVHQTEVAT